MHKGIGGTSLQIEIDNTPVFVKKVPLTDLELQPENYMSTANIFNLPMCYQYGIGSTGFGAWRELAAHVMITNWVITGQSSKHWGKGFATEGAKAVLDYAFRELNIPEIVSFTAAGNAKSIRVMQKIGLQHNEADGFATQS